MLSNTESFHKSTLHCLNPSMGRGWPIGIFRKWQNLHSFFSKLLFPLLFMISSWSFFSTFSSKTKWNFFPALDISPLHHLVSYVLTSWWLPILFGTLLSLIHSLLHPKTWCHPRWLQHSNPGCTRDHHRVFTLLWTSFGETTSSNSLSPHRHQELQHLSLLQSYIYL